MASTELSKVPQILVVGSINMDLVVRSSRLPIPGETITGSDFVEIPGGKGANQAVAAARLGASVKVIGRVGRDAFGKRLITGLKEEGIETHSIQKTDGPSGVAVIGVEDSGQNCITVIPGANGQLTPDDVHRQADAFAAADVVLLQLEVPIATVEATIAMAKQHEVTIILDPAPAVSNLPTSLFDVDFVCPNETEATIITGLEVSSPTMANTAAALMCDLGAGSSIVTLGGDGVVSRSAEGRSHRVISPSVDVVDTTAAGDAFAGAFGFQIAMGASVDEALHFACAAGALAATREGAQPSMGSLKEVLALANSTETSISD